MYKAYLLIKIKNTSRLFSQMGWFRIVFVMTLYLFLSTALVNIDNLMLLLLYSLLIMAYGNTRKDIPFINMMLGKKKMHIACTIEYCICAIPFIVISFYNRMQFEILYYPLIAFVLSFIPKCKFRYPRFSFPFLKKGGYENIRGFRSNWIAYFALFIISIFGMINHNQKVVAASVIAYSLFVADNWMVPIKMEYLLNYKSIFSFVMFKLNIIILNTLLLFSPFYILLICSNTFIESLEMSFFSYVSLILMQMGILMLSIIFYEDYKQMIIQLLSFFLLALAAVSMFYPIMILALSFFVSVLLMLSYYQIRFIYDRDKKLE